MVPRPTFAFRLLNIASYIVSDAAAFVVGACGAPVTSRFTRQVSPPTPKPTGLGSTCPKATELSHFSRDAGTVSTREQVMKLLPTVTRFSRNTRSIHPEPPERDAERSDITPPPFGWPGVPVSTYRAVSRLRCYAHSLDGLFHVFHKACAIAECTRPVAFAGQAATHQWRSPARSRAGISSFRSLPQVPLTCTWAFVLQLTLTHCSCRHVLACWPQGAGSHP